MDTAHKSPWAISEVVFGFPLLAAIGLQWVLPIKLPEGAVRLSAIPVGAVLLLAGLILIIGARREFARHGQSTEPRQSISRLIDSGVFSVSRNPLYLGIVAVLSGAALIFNVLWILLMLVPSLILCQIILIGPEERYLQHKFGDQYAAYARTVNRWLGRKG